MRGRSVVIAVLAITSSTLLLSGCYIGDDGNFTTVDPDAPPVASAAPTSDPVSAAGPRPTIVLASLDANGQGVSASGFVAGIVEDGGTCAFRFTLAGTVVERQTEAVADVSTTSCGVVQAPISEYSPGTWSLVLSYETATGYVQSEPTALEIP